jgi:hypothetical protein
MHGHKLMTKTEDIHYAQQVLRARSRLRVARMLHFADPPLIQHSFVAPPGTGGVVEDTLYESSFYGFQAALVEHISVLKTQKKLYWPCMRV